MALLLPHPRGDGLFRGVAALAVLSLADDNAAGLERCKQIFEDFCTVTASVRRGIDVGVTVREREGALNGR